jgi:hypothetical protein
VTVCGIGNQHALIIKAMVLFSSIFGPQNDPLQAPVTLRSTSHRENATTAFLSNSDGF